MSSWTDGEVTNVRPAPRVSVPQVKKSRPIMAATKSEQVRRVVSSDSDDDSGAESTVSMLRSDSSSTDSTSSDDDDEDLPNKVKSHCESSKPSLSNHSSGSKHSKKEGKPKKISEKKRKEAEADALLSPEELAEVRKERERLKDERKEYIKRSKLPNKYVSFIKRISTGASHITFERISFPKIRLRVDHLHADHRPGGVLFKKKPTPVKHPVPSQNGKTTRTVLLPETRGCHECFLLFDAFRGMYESKMKHLTLIVDTSYVPSTDGTLEDPRGHVHELEVDGEIVELPELTLASAQLMKRGKREHVLSNATAKTKRPRARKIQPRTRMEVEDDGAVEEEDKDEEDEDEDEADEEEEEDESEGEQVTPVKPSRPVRSASGRKRKTPPSPTNSDAGKTPRGGRVRRAPEAYVPTEVPLSLRKGTNSRSDNKAGAKRKRDPAAEEEESVASVEDGPFNASHINLWLKEITFFIKKTFFTEKLFGRIRPDEYAFKPHPYQEEGYQHCKDMDWEKKPSSLPKQYFWPIWKAGAGKTDLAQYLLMKNPCKKFVSLMDKSVMHQTAAHTEIFPQLSGRTLFMFVAYPEYRKMVTNTYQRKVGKNLKTFYELNESGARELLEGAVVQVDEFHRYRKLNPGSLPEMEAIMLFANFKIMLSGTPLQNQITDLFYMLVFVGRIPLMELKEILKSKYRIPRTEKEYSQLIALFLNTMFWYLPDEKRRIPCKRRDVESVLTWQQSLYMVMKSSAHPKIGNLQLSGSIGNSFDSRTRAISNCILNKDGSVRFAPKFEDVEKILQECWDAPNREKLPVALHSKYLPAGVESFDTWFAQRPLGKKMNVELMKGSTKSEDRESKRLGFINGTVDLFLFTDVGSQSLDLPDGAAIILMEILDSIGKEEQAVGRIDRSGAIAKRKNMVIEMIRMISVFPTFHDPKAKPPAHVVPELWTILEEISGKTKAELTNKDPGPDKKNPRNCWGVDVVRDLLVEMKRIGMTPDQKRQNRNEPKYRSLANVFTCFKAASIPFLNTREEYKEELKAMFADLKANPLTTEEIEEDMEQEREDLDVLVPAKKPKKEQKPNAVTKEESHAEMSNESDDDDDESHYEDPDEENM